MANNKLASALVSCHLSLIELLVITRPPVPWEPVLQCLVTVSLTISNPNVTNVPTHQHAAGFWAVSMFDERSVKQKLSCIVSN